MVQAEVRRGWNDVRLPGSSRLAFRVDPQRGLIELQERGVKLVFDLTQFGLKPADEQHTCTESVI